MLEYDICKLKNKVSTLNNTVFLIGNGNREFGLKVAKTFQKTYECIVSQCKPGKFANGEIKIDSIKENIRQKDIILIQSIINTKEGDNYYSVNDLFMELCTMIDAVIRGSAKSVTVVLPMYPYQRQDRKDCSRCPISARMITSILESLKVSRVIVFDLHASQIQGFFSSTPLDNLFSEPYFIKYIKMICHQNKLCDSLTEDGKFGKLIKVNNDDEDEISQSNSTLTEISECSSSPEANDEDILEFNRHLSDKICLVSPDEGGIKRVIRMANKMNVQSAFIYKERKKASEISRMIIMGDVRDKICFLIDDMIDTGGTACKACDLLLENGARVVYMCACHGLFSGPCFDRINNSKFKKVVVTNTVINDSNIKKELQDKIEIIDVTEMCTIAIERCLNGQSLSELINIKV
jgi:phosphoribosylpyrophosphate synthetase